MKILFILLLLCTVIESIRFGRISIKTGRRTENKFKAAFSTIGRGFKSIICRMKHHRTVLDTNNKFDKCRRKCPDNYREKYTAQWGHFCVPIIIPTGCIDESCVRCKESYKWISLSNKGSCVAECPVGYYTSPYKTCIKCTIEDCEVCSDKWTCRKCNEGHLLYATLYMKSYICVSKCPPTHERLDKDGISGCMKKYVPPTKPPTKVADIVTKPMLPPGCADQLCFKCKWNYFKFYLQTGGRVCLLQCPTGYGAVEGLCVSCSDRRCSKCDSSLSECNKCFPGYAKVLDAFNITTECVRSCPNKHKESTLNGTRICQRKVQKECPVSNCEKCVRSNLHILHRGCVKCTKGFVLFRGIFNDHCYTECPPGYYKGVKPGTDIQTCIKCNSAFCSACENGKICTKCIEPMILDPFTLKCTTCSALTDYDFKQKKCVQLGSRLYSGNTIYK